MDTEGCGSGGHGGRPPDGSPMLGGLQQASVVGHDLVLGQVQVELQRHQDGELEGDQLSAVHPEPLLQFLPKIIIEDEDQTTDTCPAAFLTASLGLITTPTHLEAWLCHGHNDT